MFRQTDGVTHVLDSGSTSLDYAFQPRLPTTLSGHAEATPFSHVFQPRFPAMSSDVPFGSRTLSALQTDSRNFTVRTPLSLISELTRFCLHYACDGDKSRSVPYSGKPTEPVPYSGKPTFVTLQDPRPRFGKHVLGLRLSATPSDHAFRPRLSATSFSHAFRPCLPTCHSDRGRCVVVTAMCQANEALSDSSSVFPRWVGHLISEGRQNVLKGHGHASEHLLSGLEIVACLRFVSVLHAKNSSNHQRRKDQKFSQLELATL